MRAAIIGAAASLAATAAWAQALPPAAAGAKAFETHCLKPLSTGRDVGAVAVSASLLTHPDAGLPSPNAPLRTWRYPSEGGLVLVAYDSTPPGACYVAVQGEGAAEALSRLKTPANLEVAVGAEADRTVAWARRKP